MEFGTGSSLRHLPFFEEVATHEEHQAEWRAATAGLLTLRLVDAWIEEGPEVVAPGTWNLVAVLKAIDAMDDGSTIPGMLRGIIAAMRSATPGDTHEVMPRILAYGRALEFESLWRLAVDAYDTIISHTHPQQESETATVAHQRRGISLRTIGRFDEALEAYAASGAVAESVGDMIGILRAKIGAAIVAMSRGNLPHADQEFESIAKTAAELGLPDQEASALDSRAAIAGFRGDHELAVRFAYDALRVSNDPLERDRILNNIGTAFHMLGIRSAARDAFLVLSVTAQEQYMRWLAMLSLMTLTAEDRSEPAFEQIRRSISVGPMPPDVKADYFLHLGRAYRALKHDDLAEISFAKAVELSERYGLSRYLFEAEKELESGRTVPESLPETLPDDGLVEIADAVRALRMHAVTSTE